MNFKEIIIIYFSGTGNALKTCEWFKESAENHNIKTRLISIDRFKEIYKPSPNALIIFCYPTHGFNVAPIMLRYIWRFPRGQNKILLLNTRGGTKFGKLFFPGLSGAALIIPILLLLFKGYKLSGCLPLDMPSNWISIHPGFTDKAKKEIVERRKEELFRYSEKIFSKGSAYSYKFFIYLPFDLAVLPIVPAYYFCGRYILAKSFYATTVCNKCQLCEENCPTESIKIIYNRPFWSYTCESCMRCINICPKKSIQTAHLFIIGFMYLLSFLPVVAGLFNFLKIDTQNDWFISILVTFMNWFVTVIFVIIAYRIFFLLLKIKFINKIFEFTSLTRYWRRYLTPDINLNKFRK